MLKLISIVMLFFVFAPTQNAVASPCRKCSVAYIPGNYPRHVPSDTSYMNPTGKLLKDSAGTEYTGLGNGCENVEGYPANTGPNCRLNGACADGSTSLVVVSPTDPTKTITVSYCNIGTHNQLVPDRGSTCPDEGSPGQPGYIPACDEDTLPDWIPVVGRFVLATGCGAYGSGCG